MSGKLYVGSVFPATLKLVVNATADDGVDLRTATSATFKSLAPGVGDESQAVDWPAAITAASELSITVTHPYAPGDLFVDGEFRVYALLTTPGGPVRSETITLPVSRRFG